MPILAGETRSLRDCEAGSLIRLPHRGASTWAIAAASVNRPEDVRFYVAFAATDPRMVYRVDENGGSPVVWWFGRDFRIDARHDDGGAIAIGGTFTPGRIVRCLPHNGDEPASYLMCLDHQKLALWLDIETGLLQQQPFASMIDVAAWEMTLLDGREPPRVIHLHDRP